MIKPLVSVILPIMIMNDEQKQMTDDCIGTMRTTTNIPYELIIVEAKSHLFSEYDTFPDNSPSRCEKYLHFPEPLGCSKEFNQGIKISEGTFVIHTGNDVFVKDGWLEALLECFEIKDCGIATLASSDLKHEPMDRIMEGVWCPMMMWRRGWEFDETFPNVFCDSDLVMRHYEAGFRMYRNWKVVVDHLSAITSKSRWTPEENAARFNKWKDVFIQKHGHSRLLMFRILSEGWII